MLQKRKIDEKQKNNTHTFIKDIPKDTFIQIQMKLQTFGKFFNEFYKYR